MNNSLHKDINIDKFKAVNDNLSSYDFLSAVRNNPNLALQYDNFRRSSVSNKGWADRFNDYISRKKTLPLLYDPFFKKLFNGDEHRQRLSRLVSSIIGQEVTVIDILPSESSSFEDSFIIMDMIVRLSDGSIANIEVQKIASLFPGERLSCYSADAIMRQYHRLSSATSTARYSDDISQDSDSISAIGHKTFSYKDMKNVHTIVLFENSNSNLINSANPELYFHVGTTTFNTHINFPLLQKYHMISLDTFRKYRYSDIIEGTIEIKECDYDEDVYEKPLTDQMLRDRLAFLSLFVTETVAFRRRPVFCFLFFRAELFRPQPAAQQMLQQRPASLAHIGICCVKISGIPGVGNITGVSGVIQQTVHSAFRVAAKNAPHVGQVVRIHAQQQVPGPVIVRAQTYRALIRAGNAHSPQLFPCALVHRVAQLFTTGSGGSRVEQSPHATFFSHLPKHKFRHGRTADIAVADEQYFGHCFHIPLPLYFALRAARFQQLFFPKDIQWGEKLHAHAFPAGGKTHFKGMGRIQAAALQHQQVPAHMRRRGETQRRAFRPRHLAEDGGTEIFRPERILPPRTGRRAHLLHTAAVAQPYTGGFPVHAHTQACETRRVWPEILPACILFSAVQPALGYVRLRQPSVCASNLTIFIAVEVCPNHEITI